MTFTILDPLASSPLFDLLWAQSNIHCEFFFKPPSMSHHKYRLALSVCWILTAYDARRHAGICCLGAVCESVPAQKRLCSICGKFHETIEYPAFKQQNSRSYIQLLIELVTTCCKRRSGLISFDKSYQQMMKQFSV